MTDLPRTTYRFTTGIVNLPLLFDKEGKKQFHTVNGKLKPVTIPNKKYLFWEIDYQDEQLLREVLLIYESLNLPVYYHKSMRGYHFLSIVPIDVSVWKKAIQELRHTNDSYPPITLRVKPNKYVDELKVFRNGSVQYTHNGISSLHEARTDQLRLWIERQHIGLLNTKYYMVKYPMDNNDITKKLSIVQREIEFIKQIFDSPIEVND